ncbi:MAG: hypothetical protein EBR82_73845 [Caulobacteraceae bacterium]|nr:hypothetical protein [Caulobacteraceae bacterium]
MILIKGRTSTSDWPVFHSGLGSQTNDVIVLNSTGAKQTITNYWNGGVSSTVFGVLNGTWAHNTNGVNYVAYCFAPVVGYSSFGAWQHNNSNDGPFIYTGFRPRFILIKNSDNLEQWYIFDSVRRTYNISGTSDTSELRPNTSAAEGTLGLGTTIDFLSNGFKIRANAAGELAFGTRNYIYAAFAESPFNYARAR